MKISYLDHNAQKMELDIPSTVEAIQTVMQERFGALVDLSDRKYYYEYLTTDHSQHYWSLSIDGLGLVATISDLPKGVATHGRYVVEEILGERFSPLMEGLSPEEVDFQISDLVEHFIAAKYGTNIAEALGKIKGKCFAVGQSIQQFDNGAILITPYGNHDWDTEMSKDGKQLTMTRVSRPHCGGGLSIDSKKSRENGIPRRPGKGRVHQR